MLFLKYGTYHAQTTCFCEKSHNHTTLQPLKYDQRKLTCYLNWLLHTLYLLMDHNFISLPNCSNIYCSRFLKSTLIKVQRWSCGELLEMWFLPYHPWKIKLGYQYSSFQGSYIKKNYSLSYHLQFQHALPRRATCLNQTNFSIIKY